MSTPQITLRVNKEVLETWKDACDRSETSVSAKIRELMNAWAAPDEGWPNLKYKE